MFSVKVYTAVYIVMLQYEMFQYEAAKCYVPAGNNIFCTCYTEIIVGSAGSDVTTATVESVEQGGRWWSRERKSSKKSAAKKKPAQRRRVTCPKAECGVSCITVVFTSDSKYLLCLESLLC